MKSKYSFASLLNCSEHLLLKTLKNLETEISFKTISLETLTEIHLENLLSDLLTFLRLQKDDTEYSISKVKISDLLIEVRQSFEGLSNYKNCVMSSKLEIGIDVYINLVLIFYNL